MKQEINFLSGQRADIDKKAKISRLVKVGSFIILIAYCLIIGVVFSYWFYLDNEVKKTDEQVIIKKNKVEELKEVESLHVLLKQRLSSLNKFFSSGKELDFVALLSYFEDLPDGVKIKGFSLSSIGGLTVSAESANALVLGEFLDKFKGDEAKSLFSVITLSSLDRQKDGTYFFVISLEPKG